MPHRKSLRCAIAIFVLGCAGAVSADGTPSMQETAEWLFSAIKGETETGAWMNTHDIDRLSCNSINYNMQRFLAGSWSEGYERGHFKWSPGDVKYRSSDPVDGMTFVIVECVAEPCISVQTKTVKEGVVVKEAKSTLTAIKMWTEMPASRVAKALNHHQSLCGGAKASPF